MGHSFLLPLLTQTGSDGPKTLLVTFFLSPYFLLSCTPLPYLPHPALLRQAVGHREWDEQG